MDEKSTGHLEEILNQVDEDGLDRYFQDYLNGNGYTKFSAFVTDVLKEKGLKRITVIRRADIP